MTISVQFIIVFICTVLSNLTDMQFLTNKLLIFPFWFKFELKILWEQDLDHDLFKFILKEGTEINKDTK